MRPPRESWRLVARAIRELARALEDLNDGLFADSHGRLNCVRPREVASFDHKVKKARAAARRLSAFVAESEECEMP